jgi:hypothetical protein
VGFFRLAAARERGGVPFLAALGFVGVVLAVSHFLSVAWLLGAATWGLAAYLCLLGCVVLGFGNPVAWLTAAGRR